MMMVERNLVRLRRASAAERFGPAPDFVLEQIFGHVENGDGDDDVAQSVEDAVGGAFGVAEHGARRLAHAQNHKARRQQKQDQAGEGEDGAGETAHDGLTPD